MDRADKVQLVIFNLLNASIVVAFVVSTVRLQWFNSFLTLMVLFLNYTPAFLKRNFRIFLPIELELFIAVFVYASVFLGSVLEYYHTFWWWDIMLHTASGVLLGIVGFLLIYIMNSVQRVRLSASPILSVFFAFAFSVALGAIWEIFEFVLDQFTNLKMQDNSLQDTMWDMIVNAIGALFVAVLGYFYLKKVHFPVFGRFITKFLDHNPRLFRWRKGPKTGELGK